MNNLTIILTTNALERERHFVPLTSSIVLWTIVSQLSTLLVRKHLTLYMKSGTVFPLMKTQPSVCKL